MDLSIPIRKIQQPESKAKTLSEMEDNIIEFAEKHLIYLSDRSLIPENPSIQEVQYLLSKYYPILLNLHNLYILQAAQFVKAQEEYDYFISSKFVELRDELNKNDIAKAKWLSATELNYKIKTTYTEEFMEKTAALKESELKEKHLKNLIKGWESFQFILSQLNKNTTSDYRQSGRDRENFLEDIL